MPAILFVEDDATIAMGVEYSLKQDGFQVSLAYRLEEARGLLKRQGDKLYDFDLFNLKPDDTITVSKMVSGAMIRNDNIVDTLKEENL